MATIETATQIRPFHVNIPEEALDDLRRRIRSTNWPEKETVEDQSQGVLLAMIQKLARYWMTDYDWRVCETKLNALPQFTTEIDGLTLHFIHVSVAARRAAAHRQSRLVGSIIEQLKIIDRLTNFTAHGASAQDAFHVVILLMPGYGFSGKPDEHRCVGPRAHGSSSSGADGAPRLQPLRRSGATAFVVDQMGLQAPSGIARHPHQYAGHRSG